MILVCVLCPALLSMKIKIRRNICKEEVGNNYIYLFVQYGIEILKNVFLTISFITYILGISDVSVSAMNSFPFFTKYVLIAAFIAMVLPYVEELIKKYIEISIHIEDKINDEKNN